MSPPITFTTISDFGNRIVVHRADKDPNIHDNVMLSLGDAWKNDPESANKFASNLVNLLNKAEYESNKD